MDLKNSIDQELWDVLVKNYNNDSYCSAILDAMHYMTETIRNKTGLEGDGSSLIGQAFGGENPKIQLNKLQTDSEKNIQKGIQDILKGFYTAIRNPRSHDKINDTKEDADSIILFINYIIKLLDKSKLSFEETPFLNRVFDKYYVQTEEYSELLVMEIPKRQRMNIGISVIIQRKNGDAYNLSYFIKALINKLEDSEITQLYKVISEELKYTTSDEDIRTILHICPAKHWNKIDKAVRLRIENIIKEDVNLGKYDSVKNICVLRGSLGTWVEAEHLIEFEENWTWLIVKKLEKNDIQEQDYASKWFWSKLCNINRDNINFWLEDYIRGGLDKNDHEIINRLTSVIAYDDMHPWWKVFEKELKNHPEIKCEEFPF